MLFNEEKRGKFKEKQLHEINIELTTKTAEIQSENEDELDNTEKLDENEV